PGNAGELVATVRVACQIHFLITDPAACHQRLGARAQRTAIGGVDLDLLHYFRKYSPMSGPLKTEAIVLRSIRYGEADRILHLYTPGYGRLAAIAKGVRRARSRFGARLEPFFHIRVILHEGRGDLHTVTGVDTIATHAGLRDHAATLDAAARACDAVAR